MRLDPNLKARSLPSDSGRNCVGSESARRSCLGGPESNIQSGTLSTGRMLSCRTSVPIAHGNLSACRPGCFAHWGASGALGGPQEPVRSGGTTGGT
jgi:hypothetical protein